MPKVGRNNKWVTLSKSTTTTPDSDGFFEDLSPAGSWARISPAPPSDDGRRITHLVTMRHHPQVNMDTRIVYATNGDIHELFVRGFQNVDFDDVELQLLCEEVIG